MVKGNIRAQPASNEVSAPTGPAPQQHPTLALPEAPVASLVEITVSNDLALFLDATIDVLITKSVEVIRETGSDKYVQPLCAATLLQLQDWLVRTSHQWSLLPSLRGHTSTGDYTVKSFVKYSCEVLVPMLAASSTATTATSVSSPNAVSRLKAMMKQVYGSCVWRSLVDQRSTLKDELQEAITRRRDYSHTTTANSSPSLSVSSSSPLHLSEEDFLGVVRPHILNGTSTVGLELTIPAPLLQTALETLLYVHTHHPDIFLPSTTSKKASKKTTNYKWEDILVAAPPQERITSWLRLVQHLNDGQTAEVGIKKGGAKGGVVALAAAAVADPWLWFSGMHVYEGVSTTNGDGEGEGVTTHDDLFAPVKNSAIDGMHVDSRLVASSSFRYLKPTTTTNSTSSTASASGIIVKRGGHGDDSSTSLLDVSSAVYRMFLLPQDRFCSVRLQPSRTSNHLRSTTTTSSYTSNLPPVLTGGDSSEEKVRMHISNVLSALEYYRYVDLPLFLRNVEGKCGRLVSVFGSIMAATDSFGRAGTAVGEDDDKGDYKRGGGSSKKSSAVAKPYQPVSHTERMAAILKAFGSEAGHVISMVSFKDAPKGEEEGMPPLTVQAEKRAVSHLSLITSATSTTTTTSASSTSVIVNIEGYRKIRETREAQDKTKESHLKGLLVINEAIEDSAYRSQITGGAGANSSTSSTHQQGSTSAQQLASAQEVGIKNETLSSFLKEASIAFDMRIMSLAAAIVGYAMAHFRGMSPGVCVVFAAVCAALMTLVDALLLFTRLTKDDQARSKKVRSEEYANRAKERKRL